LCRGRSRKNPEKQEDREAGAHGSRDGEGNSNAVLIRHDRACFQTRSDAAESTL
jgi:hypothetical protein